MKAYIDETGKIANTEGLQHYLDVSGYGVVGDAVSLCPISFQAAVELITYGALPQLYGLDDGGDKPFVVISLP